MPGFWRRDVVVGQDLANRLVLGVRVVRGSNMEDADDPAMAAGRCSSEPFLARSTVTLAVTDVGGTRTNHELVRSVATDVVVQDYGVLEMR